MTRRLPPPWRAEKFSGGYVMRDANGFAVAYVYGRSTEEGQLELPANGSYIGFLKDQPGDALPACL
jgi:hypothetical protein